MIKWWSHVKKEFSKIKKSIIEEVNKKLEGDSFPKRLPGDNGRIIFNLHNQTDNFRKNSPDWQNIPSVFKKINSEKITLPKNFPQRTMTVLEAIVQRVSRREFGKPLSLEEISEILYFANGFKGFADREEYGLVYKTTAPSAGSRHPLEIYLILNDVSGIKAGVYHFDVENHALEVISGEKIKDDDVLRLIDGQQTLAGANFLFITAIHERTFWKYGPRSYRFIHLDAGHIGQNIYLIGEAMGLSVCAIGGWDRELAKEILTIDEENELVVYLLAIGKK